jgi:hypothetical protein
LDHTKWEWRKNGKYFDWSMLQKRGSRLSIRKEDFIVLFEASLKNKNIGSAFFEFLKSEFNEEPWIFLDEVQQLKEMKDETKILKRINQLYETFIEEKSKYELNISSTTRENLKKIISHESKKWTLETNPSEIFDEVVETMIGQLRHDSWKRFYRSKYCEEIILKYHDDSSICSPLTTLQYFYEPEYFENVDILDSDFDFGKTLLEDNYNWELVGSKAEYQVNSYFTTLKFLPNLPNAENIGAMKYQCVLPFSMHQCLIGIFAKSFSLKSEPTLYSVTTQKYLSFDDLSKEYEERGMQSNLSKYPRGIACTRGLTWFPFPLNTRQASNSVSFTYNSKTKTFFAVYKSHSNDFKDFGKKKKMKLPNRSGKIIEMEVYSIFSFVFFEIQNVGDHKTLFNSVILIEIGGWVNNKMIFKKLASGRGMEMRKTYTKIMSQIPDNATINDYKDEFLSICEDGMPNDGNGKLLYETHLKLNIDY